jgi:hypothetical protein
MVLRRFILATLEDVSGSQDADIPPTSFAAVSSPSSDIYSMCRVVIGMAFLQLINVYEAWQAHRSIRRARSMVWRNQGY